MFSFTLPGPDKSKWSMLQLEYAEYNHGTPMSIELDCGELCAWELDDSQPLMSTSSYVETEHSNHDWDSIDEEAMALESDYWFSMGCMVTRLV